VIGGRGWSVNQNGGNGAASQYKVSQKKMEITPQF
jgi:hypothetical protein